ncbi:MAG: hybrid sensor histidine kinase/response regulator [Anaerovoracaceae bacterium]|jgi:CheY-like chemotaxis protein
MFSQEMDGSIKIRPEYLLGVCHDFRTPLSVIMGMAALARTELENKEKMKGYLSRINTTSNYLLELINNIMDSSKISAGKMGIEYEIFDMYELIHTLKAMIIPQTLEKNQNFQVKLININEKYLVGDILRLNQILMNLLTNAVKYTAINGTIVLEIKQKYKKKNCIYMEFNVCDTGIGMSQEFITKMFEPFEQEKDISCHERNRTGLGLYITKNLISLMGGTIKVESQPMKGTNINIKIPLNVPSCHSVKTFVEDSNLKNQEKKNDPLTLNEHKYCFIGKRILVAEDNVDCLEIIQELLNTTGLSVECVDNGHEAVELFEASEPGYYDAILMDIMMPKMNGLMASSRIRNSNHPDGKNITIIAMTASAFPEEIEATRRAGMDTHIVKPINFNQLLDYLKKVFSNDKNHLQKNVV